MRHPASLAQWLHPGCRLRASRHWQRKPAISLTAPILLAVISDSLTIPSIGWSGKKPPAGVHVEVDFNLNVAVHPSPATLGFLIERGEWEGSGDFVSRGG